MVETIYSNWLTIAPAIYYAYAIIAIFFMSPKGATYVSYNISRRLFGILSIAMGTYIGSLGLFEYRSTDIILSTSINMLAYYFAILVCGSIFFTLLDSKFFTWKRIQSYAAKWLIWFLALTFNYVYATDLAKKITVFIFAFLLFVEAVIMIRSFFKAYNEAKKKIENHYSDNVEPFMKWMTNSLYILIALGLFGCLHAYYPAWLNLAYGIFSALLFSYVLISFINYMVTLNEVRFALYAGNNSDMLNTAKEMPNCEIENAIKRWVDANSFTKAGVTVEDLANALKIDSKDIVKHINSHYNLTFKEWITILRIEYSKEILNSNPELRLAKVAEMVGYSHAGFTTAFTKICGVSPSAWLCGVTKLRA